MAAINPPTIPISLQSLFADAGFLGSAQDDEKPCITARCYVHKDSWIGYGYRRWNRENPDKTKHFIRTTCEAIAQNLSQYADTPFYDIILTKIIKLRTGLIKIAETYKSDVVVKDHIGDSVMILDMKIPEHIKIQHGFSTVNRPQVAPLGPGVVMPSSVPPPPPPATPESKSYPLLPNVDSRATISSILAGSHPSPLMLASKTEDVSDPSLQE